MYKILLIMFLLVSTILIVVIMLQNKKDIGLTFNTHNLSNILSNSISTGSAIIKLTIILAILFFLFSLLLANLTKNIKNKDNIWQSSKHLKCVKNFNK